MEIKVAWIYPIDRKDGISLYGHRYVQALQRHMRVDSIDAGLCCTDRSLRTYNLNGYDIVHIQYEPSLYILRGKDYYPGLCTSISRPRIVTIHEIYEQFPGVFPRENIRGKGLIRRIKEAVYDIRHPIQTCFHRHHMHAFWARRLMIHYPYQKSIIARDNVTPDIVDVFPHPLVEADLAFSPQSDSGRDEPLHIGSTGFININYNYSLLFDSLDRLEIPWRFTWIGGPRSADDLALLNSIKSSVVRRGWEAKFVITGWVSDEDQMRLLSTMHVYLALFTHRSASGSVLMALAARKPVIATPLPLIADINNGMPCMLVARNATEIATAIQQIRDSSPVRDNLLASAGRYASEHTYAKMAEQVLRYYSDFLDTQHAVERRA